MGKILNGLFFLVLIFQLFLWTACKLEENISDIQEPNTILQKNYNLSKVIHTKIFLFDTNNRFPLKNIQIKIEHSQPFINQFSMDNNSQISIDLPIGTFNLSIYQGQKEHSKGTVTVTEGSKPVFTIENTIVQISEYKISTVGIDKQYYTEPIQDTGQNHCYTDDEMYSKSDCEDIRTKYFPGQDGILKDIPSKRYPLEHINSSLYPNDFGVASQNLVWIKCPFGLGGADCLSGKHQYLTYSQAEISCSTLNDRNEGFGYLGKNRWRLPEIHELRNLVDMDQYSPAIHTAMFPGTSSDYYWTSTKSNEGYKVLNFLNGTTTDRPIHNKAGVYCVRGDKKSIQPSIPMNSNIVYDSNTELVWEKCIEGETGDNCIGNPQKMNWKQALIHCMSLSIYGKKWRLPNINELYSYQPNSNLHKTYTVWSSTSVSELNEGKNSLVLNYESNNIETYLKTNYLPTRCVSGPEKIFIKETEKLDEPNITEFSFFNKKYKALINKNLITTQIPYTLDEKQLIAEFETSKDAVVTVENIVQKSKETINDFSLPIMYKVTDSKGKSNYFFVRVFKQIPISSTGVKKCHDKFFANEKFTCGEPRNLELPRQDGNYKKDLKNEYTELNENLIKDNVKELIWKKCPEGLYGKKCIEGELKLMDQESAKNYCSKLNTGNGFMEIKKWRLPSVQELTSIIDYSGYKPAIIKQVFPNTPNMHFWTDTRSAVSYSNYWSVNFLDGTTNDVNPIDSSSSKNSNLYAVRCVSGEVPNLRFLYDLKDGTVMDASTGLLWEKCFLGQDASCRGYAIRFNWKGALKYCRKLKLAGKKWRLPNPKELQSLLDYNLYNHSFNSEFFPWSKENKLEFWTSTTMDRFEYDYRAYIIQIDFGTIKTSPKHYSHHVKCVTDRDYPF